MKTKFMYIGADPNNNLVLYHISRNFGDIWHLLNNLHLARSRQNSHQVKWSPMWYIAKCVASYMASHLQRYINTYLITNILASHAKPEDGDWFIQSGAAAI